MSLSKHGINFDTQFRQAADAALRTYSTIDDNGCWVWFGRIKKGIPFISGVVGDGLSARKLAAILELGHDLPPGEMAFVSLTCDPLCTNPEHMFVGKWNERDGHSWDRIDNLFRERARERLLKNSDVTEDGCWLWKLSITVTGYGFLKFSGKQTTAHRLACVVKFGYVVPEGMVARHHCGQPTCCNPDHVSPMTRSQSSNFGGSASSSSVAINDSKKRKLSIDEKFPDKELLALSLRRTSRTCAPPENALSLLGSNPSDCLLWTGSKLRIYGIYKGTMVHRLSDFAATGVMASKNTVVRHLCGVGLCFNPAHLMKGTDKDNAHDRIAHGTTLLGEANGFSMLKIPQVLEIRRLFAAGGITKAQLARDYSTSESNITSIIIRKTWKHLPPVEETSTLIEASGKRNRDELDSQTTSHKKFRREAFEDECLVELR